MEIDPSALAAAVAEEQFTGVVAVDVADEPGERHCHGFANRPFGVLNRPETRFALASGSKTFTALGILRLVESGRLGLGSLVRPVLGADLPLIEDAVTVEQLLAHTSGMGDYLDESDDWDVSDYVLPVPVHTLATTSGFLPMLDGHPQAFPPGERFAYCNGGYVVLALVIERVSGLDFHTFLQTEVFDRAGLAATSYLRSDELPGDAAVGYLEADGDRSNVLHLPVRGNGDGGAYSTAADLHRFWQALLGGRILGPDLLAEFVRPRNEVPDEPLWYGLGVYVDPDTGVLAMEGYDAGVSMRSLHDPSTQATASVLGNTSEGAWPIAELLLDAITSR
jgi:CubicO group peptidase (beta-lactamase class C family)